MRVTMEQKHVPLRLEYELPETKDGFLILWHIMLRKILVFHVRSTGSSDLNSIFLLSGIEIGLLDSFLI